MALTLSEEPARLRTGSGAALGFAAIQHYQIVAATGQQGPWKVSTKAYYYTVHDGAGRELLAYHWHPHSDVTMPHLHLGAGLGIEPDHLITPRLHVPTGRIALEDVVEFLIVQLGVRPRRNDWEAVIRKSRERYRQWKTW